MREFLTECIVVRLVVALPFDFMADGTMGSRMVLSQFKVMIHQSCENNDREFIKCVVGHVSFHIDLCCWGGIDQGESVLGVAFLTHLTWGLGGSCLFSKLGCCKATRTCRSLK